MLISHLLGTPFADFLEGKWAKIGYLAKYCSILPHSCSYIYIYAVYILPVELPKVLANLVCIRW